MKVLAILALTVVVVLAAPKEEINPYVFGGVNALPGEFPFIVSIQRIFLGRSNHVCSGVILNNIWILSAAQCITEIPESGSLEVIAGAHNLRLWEDWQARVGVERNLAIIHPDWERGRRHGPNDIALVRVSAPLTFSAHIRPVRLPAPNTTPVGTVRLSGWGETAGSNSNILQKAVLATITLDSCRTAVHGLNLNASFITERNLCTGPLTGGISICTGDHGTPLIKGENPNQEIVGIASWIITPCGRIGAPSGIYTRVSAYNEWIFNNTGVAH